MYLSTTLIVSTLSLLLATTTATLVSSTHTTACGGLNFIYTTGPVNGSCVVTSVSAPPTTDLSCAAPLKSHSPRFCVMEKNTTFFEGNGFGPTIEVILADKGDCSVFETACTK